MPNVSVVLAEKFVNDGGGSDGDMESSSGVGASSNTSIPNITSYQYFKMAEGGVFVKHHGVIGVGKFIPLEPLPIGDDLI